MKIPLRILVANLIWVAAGLAVGFTNFAAGEQLLNVGLVRFEAFATEDGVRLEWDVATEVGTAGYKIKRGENGNFAHLTDAQGGDLFIIAEGGPAQPASYAVEDAAAVYGNTYTYQLVEITEDGSENVEAETQIELVILPTNTPIVFGGVGGEPGSNNSPGATLTPSATSTATGTRAPTASPTSILSPTRNAPTPIASATYAGATSGAPPTTSTNSSAMAENGPASYPAANGALDAPSIVSGSAGVVQALPETSASATTDDMSAPPNESSAAVSSADAPVAESASVDGVSGSGASLPETAGDELVVVAGSPAAEATPSTLVPDTAVLQTSEDRGSSLLLLWAAFVVALLVFAGSVVGAILLYNRQRQSD